MYFGIILNLACIMNKNLIKKEVIYMNENIIGIFDGQYGEKIFIVRDFKSRYQNSSVMIYIQTDSCNKKHVLDIGCSK